MLSTDGDLASLAAGHDIITLGMRADEARRAFHGTRTTFVRVADAPVEPGSPIRVPAVAGELRLVGAPATRAAAAARLGEALQAAGDVPVTAFALSELEDLAARDHVTLRTLLEELRAAGLETIAEAAFDRLRDPRRAIEEVNIAGLALARLTLDQLPAAGSDRLLESIAALQGAVAVIRAFAPLPRRVNPAAPTTGYEDVKRVALARLVVDNIPTIQVDWSLYGPKLAQVALTVGANDVDAVSCEEDTGQGRRRAPLEEIRRNIRAAGFEPVERNGRFETMAR